MYQKLLLNLICASFFLPALGQESQMPRLSPPKHGETYVIAHRGAHKDAPENSLPAYQKAIDLGCDFIEIDVRSTNDSELVSIHNADIDRYVPGQTGHIKEMTLEEIKQLDIGQRVDEKWRNTRIPTLAEILQLSKGNIGIYLDLKEADPSLIIKKIDEYQLRETIVWYIPASYGLVIQNILKNCPGCLVMPDPGPVKNLEKVMDQFQPKVIASDMGHLSRKFINKAHQKSVMVFVDDSENDLSKLKKEWKKMIRWGVDGIQTDEPEALIEFLNMQKNRSS